MSDNLEGRTFTAEFAIGEVVYHRMATERRPGIINMVCFFPGGVSYRVAWGPSNEDSCYGIELTREYETEYAPLYE